MRLVKSLALAPFLLGASALVSAQAADPVFTMPSALPSGWVVTLKGNVRVGPSYPGSDDFNVVGFPSVSVRRAGTVERFSAPDDGLSLSFVDESALRIGAVGRFQGGRYLQDDRRLFGLRKIDWAVEPGVFVEYWPLEFLRARAELRHGINGHGHGWREDPRMLRAYTWATLLWVGVFAARLVVQGWLYDAREETWLGIARLVMGFPLFAVALFGTVIAVRRAGRTPMGA